MGLVRSKRKIAFLWRGRFLGPFDKSNEFQSERLFIFRGTCLLNTSDTADDRISQDLGARRIIKK
ncbi:MAG: hypothetical protein K6U74_01210, partial [Firmicutes bacterium]|nr:hypothetical protein [Bacillota bacterium]